MTPLQREAFQALGPHALVVVGSDGPVSLVIADAAGEIVRRIGHNRGVWPVRLATSAAWRDTVTHRYDVDPFLFVGTQLRLWCASEAHVGRLSAAVYARLDQMQEEAGADGAGLLHGFRDVGPAFSYAFFEMEIAGIADRLGLAVWDDDGLLRQLDRLAADAMARKRAAGRS